MTTNPNKLERLLLNLNRVLWFTDIHMKPSNIERCAQLFDVVKSVILYGVDGKQCDGVIFSGDMHDGKDNISVKCQNLLLDFVRSLEKHGKTLIVVPGNHDYEETIRAHHYERGANFPGHSLAMLDGFSNVGVIDDVYSFDELGFVPYRGNNIKFLDDLHKIGKSVKYLFAHDGVFGADLGNGMLDDFSVPTSAFRQFRRVFMGHYHKFHEIQNITYLGSPFTQSFGESNQQKFVGIIERSNGELTLVPTDMPTHMTLEVNADEEVPNSVSIVPGFTRIIVTGKKENIEKALRKISKDNRLEDAKIVIKANSQRRDRMTISEEMKESKMIEIYLNNMQLDLDKDRLLKLAVKFMENAKNADL